MSYKQRLRMIEPVLRLRRSRPAVTEATCEHPGWTWFNEVGGRQYQICARCGMPRHKLWPRFRHG